MRSKALFSLIFLSLLSFTGFTQNQNPYQSIGKKGKILTLSDGKYDETFEKDSLERVGSVVVNRKTRKIENLNANSTAAIPNNANQSRFLSVDPVTKEFAQLSPYQYASNRPIDGTDLDGLEYKRVTFWIDGIYGDGSPKIVKTATDIQKDIYFREYSTKTGKPTGRTFGRTDVFYIDRSTGNISQGKELYEEISPEKPVPSSKYDYSSFRDADEKDKDDGNYLIHQYANNDFLASLDLYKRDLNAPDNAQSLESLAGLQGVAAIIGAPFQIRGLQAAWVEESTAGWSNFSKAYQKQITGQEGRALEINGVKFDGLRGQTLIDAKGYYEYLLSRGFAQEGLLQQAKRQIQAANGLGIEWHFAEKGAADAVRGLLEKNGIKGIEVFHTPSISQ